MNCAQRYFARLALATTVALVLASCVDSREQQLYEQARDYPCFKTCGQYVRAYPNGAHLDEVQNVWAMLALSQAQVDSMGTPQAYASFADHCYHPWLKQWAQQRVRQVQER